MLEAAFKTFVKTPVVTVAVEETRPLQVSVLGEVAKPGTYKLTPGTDVLTALALAGGITPFAQRDGIYIVRRVSVTATPGAQRAMRIRFRYQALTRGDAPAAGFQVQDADVLVVE